MSLREVPGRENAREMSDSSERFVFFDETRRMGAPISLDGRNSLFSAQTGSGGSVTSALCPGRFGAARPLGRAAPNPPPPQPGRNAWHLPRCDGVTALYLASISDVDRIHIGDTSQIQGTH